MPVDGTGKEEDIDKDRRVDKRGPLPIPAIAQLLRLLPMC